MKSLTVEVVGQSSKTLEGRFLGKEGDDTRPNLRRTYPGARSSGSGHRRSIPRSVAGNGMKPLK
jgi:hypothetical protein